MYVRYIYPGKVHNQKFFYKLVLSEIPMAASWVDQPVLCEGCRLVLIRCIHLNYVAIMFLVLLYHTSCLLRHIIMKSINCNYFMSLQKLSIFITKLVRKIENTHPIKCIVIIGGRCLLEYIGNSQRERRRLPRS